MSGLGKNFEVIPTTLNPSQNTIATVELDKHFDNRTSDEDFLLQNEQAWDEGRNDEDVPVMKNIPVQI